MKMSALPQRAIFEAGIWDSISDREVKRASSGYYRANFAMFQALAQEIEAALHTGISFDPTQLRVVYSLARSMAFDSQALLRTAAKYKFGISGFSVQSSEAINPVDLVIWAGNCARGNATGDAHCGIPLFRCALEMRIRRALGVIGRFRKTDDALIPLNLSELLDAIEHDESTFHMAIPLANIRRANSWANIYIHMATRTYAWQPIFITRYFAEFLTGSNTPLIKKAGQVFSIHSGIVTPTKTLNRIRKRLEKKCGQNEGLALNPSRYCDVLQT